MFLIVNTVGIFEIVYLILFKKDVIKTITILTIWTRIPKDKPVKLANPIYS
jgi:hypothetical protein